MPSMDGVEKLVRNLGILHVERTLGEDMFLIEDIHSPINLFPLYSAILVPTSVIPSLYPQCLNRQLTISRVDETSLQYWTQRVLYCP